MQKIHSSNVGKTIINDPFGTGFIPGPTIYDDMGGG